jgi:hypothetical protein
MDPATRVERGHEMVISALQSALKNMSHTKARGSFV